MSSIASAPVAPNSSDMGTGLEQLLQFGKLVPVITIERVEDAVPLARALVAGGLRLLESP